MTMTTVSQKTRANGSFLDAAGRLVSIKKKRFCESCRQYKPKDKAPAVKGWRCLDCRVVKK